MKIFTPPAGAFRFFLISFGAIAFSLFYFFRIEASVYTALSTGITTSAFLFILFALFSLITTAGTGRHQVGYILIAIGVSSALLGQCTGALLPAIVSSQTAVFVSTGFFVLTYVLNLLGYLYIAKSIQVNVFEYFGNIVGFFLLGVILVTIANAVHPIAMNPIGLGFLSGDIARIIVITLVLQMTVIYQGGIFGRSWLSIFVGNLFIVFGSFAQSMVSTQYAAALWPFTLIDIIYLGGYLFVANGFYGIASGVQMAQKTIVKHKPKQA